MYYFVDPLSTAVTEVGERLIQTKELVLSVGMLLSTLDILSAGGSLWPRHYLESVRLLVWGSISSLYLPTAAYIHSCVFDTGEVQLSN